MGMVRAAYLKIMNTMVKSNQIGSLNKLEQDLLHGIYYLRSDIPQKLLRGYISITITRHRIPFMLTRLSVYVIGALKIGLSTANSSGITSQSFTGSKI